MNSFFDIDELFGDFDAFHREIMKRLQEEIDETEKAVKSDKLKGDWDVKRIDRPGVKGYIIQGRFWTDKPFEALEPFDPIEPLRPTKRRPMLGDSVRVPEEAREPLTDILEEDKAVKVYIELPGEEKDDIQLSLKDKKLEVKAKRFYKIMDLPNGNIDKEKMTSNYKNGVLEVTIPKEQESDPKYYKL